LNDNSGFFFLDKWEHHTLRMDEQFSVTPSDAINLGRSPFQETDLAIVVEYQPWFLRISRSKAFRFQARRQQNGHFHWYATPLR
jgi:hypothetical protein